MTELQTALGELRDCDLWIDDLGARLDRHREESGGGGGRDADARVRPAAIWLLNHFTKERGKHFHRALARWHKWETRGFFERMREALNDGQTARPEAAAGGHEADTADDDTAGTGNVAEESAPASQESGAGPTT